MYKCKYFKISELVAPALVKALPENTLWALFDERLLRMADAIREKYGPMTINTPDLTDCGLRDPQSKTGAKYSMHKIGRALDGHIVAIERAAAKITDAAARKKYKITEYNRVRAELMADPAFDCLCFEQNSKECPNGINWLHFDTGNRANRLFNA